MSYDGLPDSVRKAVYARDRGRCRWCGVTNRGVDVHHIRYRRGPADDVSENLVSLCRSCHSFVHGNPRPGGQTIVKSVAQHVLLQVLANPGTTGGSVWRRLRRKWELAGLCVHGGDPNVCLYC